MMNDLFSVSLSMSVLILVFLLFRPLLERFYQAKLRYWLWLLVAVRLIIPVPVITTYSLITIPAVPETIGYYQEDRSAFSSVEQGVQLEKTDADAQAARMENGSLSAHTQPLTFSPVVATAIWAGGALVFLMYHFVGYWIFKRKIRAWCVLKERVVPPVFTCKKISSPMLIGLIRPAILLPEAEYAQENLQMIIAHEMIHYCRKDLLYKMILLLANALHWFNPLVYVMVGFANKDLEFSCDEQVVKGKDADYKVAYIKSIINAIQVGQNNVFSTYFKGGKKDMKKRFTSILEQGKKRTGVLICMIAALAVILSGTLVACTNLNTAEAALGYEQMLPLMGLDKQNVLDRLGVDVESAQISQVNEEEDYILESKILGQTCKVGLIFYNDVFMGFQYLFNDTQAAYQYASDLRQGIEAAYGEKTTYPGMQSSDKGYFDEINDASELIELVEYYEDWTPQVDEEQMEKMLGDIDYLRMDLRLNLMVMPENHAQITVRYVAIRSSLG